MNLKKLNLTVLLVTIIVLVPTIQIVYASSLSTLYLSGGKYPRATYTIWKEGITYYVKNAYGFQPSWSSSNNFSYVINTCIDACDSYLGKIYITSGLYFLTSSIIIPQDRDRITLEGDGKGTQLEINTAEGGINCPAILLNGTGGTVCYTTIRDLGISIANFAEGTYTSACINITGKATQTTIENVWLWQRGYAGGSKDGMGILLYAPDNTYVTDTNIGRVRIEFFDDGIVYEVGTSNCWITESHILSSWITVGKDACIEFRGSPTSDTSVAMGNNHFTSVTLEMASVPNAVGINMTASTNMRHNHFVSVVAEDLHSSGYFAKVNANCTGSEFIACKPLYLYGTTTIDGLPVEGLLIWGGGGYTTSDVSTFIPNCYHPTTTLWGTNMTGAIWFCLNDTKIEYWNGTEIITP